MTHSTTQESFVDTPRGTLTILDSVVSNLSNLRDFLVGLKSSYFWNPRLFTSSYS